MAPLKLTRTFLHLALVAQVAALTSRMFKDAEMAENAVAFYAHGFSQPERPRMLVSLGCSGSSILMDFSRTLLAAHGIPTSTPGGGSSGELMKHNWNPFYVQGEGMAAAMERTQMYALAQNATLVFKEQGAQSADFRDAAPLLKKLGTFVVHSYRENQLDRYICMVRDCFLKTPFGESVDSQGQKSDICGKRRAGGASNTAKINIDELHGKMVQFAEAASDENKRIQAAGFADYPSLSNEELLDFEHDSSKFDAAVESWKQFLVGWGVAPDTKLIQDLLGKYVGKYGAEPQSQTVYNYAEVKEELLAYPELASYLRD